MGHDLLEKGVKGEFKFKGSISGARADLASASPGLLFLLLGVILIGYAMALNKGVQIVRPSTPVGPPTVILPPLPDESAKR